MIQDTAILVLSFPTAVSLHILARKHVTGSTERTAHLAAGVLVEGPLSAAAGAAASSLSFDCLRLNSDILSACGIRWWPAPVRFVFSGP